MFFITGAKGPQGAPIKLSKLLTLFRQMGYKRSGFFISRNIPDFDKIDLFTSDGVRFILNKDVNLIVGGVNFALFERAGPEYPFSAAFLRNVVEFAHQLDASTDAFKARYSEIFTHGGLNPDFSC
jgi:hypothetical protein